MFVDSFGTVLCMMQQDKLALKIFFAKLHNYKISVKMTVVLPVSLQTPEVEATIVYVLFHNKMLSLFLDCLLFCMHINQKKDGRRLNSIIFRKLLHTDIWLVFIEKSTAEFIVEKFVFCFSVWHGSEKWNGWTSYMYLRNQICVLTCITNLWRQTLIAK